MQLVVLFFVGFAAFLTSILSALAGLGGGIILLAVIAQFFAPLVAIPIHGGIQLVSNGSRAVLLRRDVAWLPVAQASVLLFPASLLGVAVATAVPETATRLVLSSFILVLVWRPSLVRWTPEAGLSGRGLVGVGAVSGLLNTTVGASGPFTSPFFKAVTASHRAFVATAATSQVFAHGSKLAAFGLDGFAFGEHLDVMAAGAVGVTLGSIAGTRLLGRVDEARLAQLFRTVLTVLALRIFVSALV